MTLEETAIAFCREILGRKNPKQVVPDGHFLVDDVSQSFYYLNMNVVTAAVAEWADMRQCVAQLSIRATTYTCSVVSLVGGTGIIGASRGHDNPCQALMSACIEANRKLKEIRNDRHS